MTLVVPGTFTKFYSFPANIPSVIHAEHSKLVKTRRSTRRGRSRAQTPGLRMRAGIVVAPGGGGGGGEGRGLSTCSGELSRKRGHRTPQAAAAAVGVTLSRRPRGPILLLLVLPCTNFRPPPSSQLLHLLSPPPRPVHPLRISQSFPPSSSDCMSAAGGSFNPHVAIFVTAKSTEPDLSRGGYF